MNSLDNVVNAETLEWRPEQPAGAYRADTKNVARMGARLGRLGANLTRVPPGSSGCPLHTHAIEDEFFYILSGKGVLRYGAAIRQIGPGDCISCPAGCGVAHQLANPFDEPLVFLAVGVNDAHEVCTYPDTGKVMVRALALHGRTHAHPYYEDEPQPPVIFALAAERGIG